MRNSFNLSAITNLPLGFKFNPILIARSGLPYTPILGFDTQNDANDWNDRAILNGLVAPRNFLRQPGFFDLDIRFVKDIKLPGEGRHLDLFMDIFNLTNSANRNFGPEAISVFGTPAAPIYQRRPSPVCSQHQPDRQRPAGAVYRENYRVLSQPFASLPYPPSKRRFSFVTGSPKNNFSVALSKP